MLEKIWFISQIEYYAVIKNNMYVPVHLCKLHDD